MAGDPGQGSLHGEVWRVVELLRTLPVMPLGGGHSADELTALFASLEQSDEASRGEVEERIWTVWCDHRDRDARLAMRRGVSLLGRGELDEAMSVFDELVARYPTWAEAWNKRATIHFLLGQDSASVRDIYRALEIEPRHFGALGGFAQICVRNGAPDAAHAALKCLLRLIPAAPGLADAVAASRDGAPGTTH